jgi:hypothetical protein
MTLRFLNGVTKEMIKKVSVLNYSQEIPFEENERWFFEQHASLMKKVPHLVKYVSYRFLTVDGSDHFRPAQFHRMEELWWTDRDSFRAGEASDEYRNAIENQNDPKRGPHLIDVRHALLEKELNLLHPEMTGHFELTMNELNGKPHIKSLWCFMYREELSAKEVEDWNLNHHFPLAARNFNLLGYFSYSPAEGLGIDQRFSRYNELCWPDVETMLNDIESPRGREVIKDNEMANGEWRETYNTSLFDHPHVVGHQVVFV